MAQFAPKYFSNIQNYEDMFKNKNQLLLHEHFRWSIFRLKNWATNSELLEYAVDMWESLVQAPALIAAGSCYKAMGYFTVYVFPSFL